MNYNEVWTFNEFKYDLELIQKCYLYGKKPSRFYPFQRNRTHSSLSKIRVYFL